MCVQVVARLVLPTLVYLKYINIHSYRTVTAVSDYGFQGNRPEFHLTVIFSYALLNLLFYRYFL